MNLQTFFDNFELLAEAPNGVQKLRELILQLAVMGKLAPQDPNDEPASALLEQIRFKKELIYQERKLKKERLLPIKLDNTSFNIPATWQWCRLQEITEKLGAGSTPKGGKSVYKETGIKFIRSQNVWNNGLYLENVAYIPLSIHQRMNGTIVQPGDILLNITGASIGRSCIVPDDFDEGNVSQHVAIVRLLDKRIRYYLHLCLISPYIQDCIMGVQVGISREGLSMASFKDFLIPLPPLNEIIRIGYKVGQLMKLCDELEARQQKKQEARVTINNTAIAQLLAAREPEEFNKSWQRIYNNFDLLYSTPENIGKLRSCILQLAVMGKLAPQDPRDEPASVLLDKIKAEKKRLVEEGKINKSGNILSVSTNKFLSTLPKGWLCVPLGECIDLISGQHLNQDEQNDKEEGLPYLTGPSDFGKVNPIVTRWTLTPKAIAENNDILITVKGAGVGKTNILSFKKAAIGRQLMAIRPILLNTNYIYILILAYHQIFQSLGTGSTVPGLSREDILSFSLPLPPLNEQHCIVAKVNQLMALCDQLEAQLKQSVADSEKLMETAVRQLLDVNTIAVDDISAEPTKLETKTVKQSSKKIHSHLSGEAMQLNLPLF
ncbi:restriction modification system DNA specificity domain protein [Calothrix sp. NIES-4071]|nr:restriction modification system DNA specificity domain protein [Calothrix sp. NIES-4071]BAZ61144.1 restriction modification system DNA specificity domain protein [Calothrix sp. NIES-4105]